jgi:hypothetical protein
MRDGRASHDAREMGAAVWRILSDGGGRGVDEKWSRVFLQRSAFPAAVGSSGPIGAPDASSRLHASAG